MTSSVEKQNNEGRENTAEDTSTTTPEAKKGMQNKSRIPEVSAQKLDGLRDKSLLKSLRISADTETEIDNDNPKLQSLNISARKAEEAGIEVEADEEEAVLMLKPENKLGVVRPAASKIMGRMATIITGL